MNIVDWVLVGAVVVFALAGWYRGFVAGLFSFAGFLGGGLAAALLLPTVLEPFVESDMWRVVAVGVGVLVCAILGQVFASILGGRLRDHISWRPARFVDNAGGALLNVLAVAMVTWIVASAVAILPVTLVSEQVSNSRVLGALDALVPEPARNAFTDLRGFVGTTSVPRVFAGLTNITGPDVDPPDPAAVTAAVDQSRPSVVRVMGETPECSSAVSGSGFVFSRNRVLTNAHVVAGVDAPVVQVRQGEPELSATVVYFDPAVDVAVLYVPDLRAQPLAFAPAPVGSGASAVVAGFPESGPYRSEPARVRALVQARGEDIYGSPGVDREVYTLRSDVRPGNSGGPLLDPTGAVLGMVFGASDDQTESGYALTAADLDAAAAAGVLLTDAVGTGTCRIRD